ncbi:MAG: hypothetical protein ACRD15_15565 [Vicinamibacterales bacterium]
MQQRGWIDLLIIAAVALVVHGLLLVDSGVYFDDWLVYTFVVKRDWHLLTAIVRDRGIPPIEQYYWWMFRDLPVFGYRAAVFIMIIGSAWLAMLVGRASTFLSRQESLLVAVFIVCYSGFQSWVLFCTSQYVFFYCLFLAAALLAFQAEREQGWRHWARRGAALTLFATSYCLGSLLFLTMVFGVLLLLHIKKIRGLTILRLIVTGVPRRLDYFALPVIYWYGVHWLIPPRGLLEGYNTVLRSTDAIVSNLKQFAINSVAVQFRTGLDALGQHPSAIVAAVALAVVVWSLGKRWGDPAPTPTKWLLPFALVWAIGAMFPYAAVNKPAAPIGWDTRHALLVSYPLGVAIVALARLFQPRRATYMSLAAVLAVISLPAGMAITTMRTYVDL